MGKGVTARRKRQPTSKPMNAQAKPRSLAVIDEIAAAHEWQIAQAWQTALDSYSGKERLGSWSRVKQEIEPARARERDRPAQG